MSTFGMWSSVIFMLTDKFSSLFHFYFSVSKQNQTQHYDVQSIFFIFLMKLKTLSLIQQHDVNIFKIAEETNNLFIVSY